MISKDPNITRILKEYRERILSLEGQAAELSGRVSEDDIIQRRAEDMASKRSDEDMELYKARLREELRVEAEANAEKKFEVKRKSIEDRERLVELKEHGLQLKTDAVNAAVKELSADKTQFDEQKSGQGENPVYYAWIFCSLKRKYFTSDMPLSWALKIFILALKDSAEALVDLLSKKFRISI